MTLHMIQLTPDMVSAAVWAQQNGVASADDGYLMHALLKASFGPLSPKPFAVMAKRGRPAKILAYSIHYAEDLSGQARMFAEPVALEAIGLGGMAARFLWRNHLTISNPAAISPFAHLGFTLLLFSIALVADEEFIARWDRGMYRKPASISTSVSST